MRVSLIQLAHRDEHKDLRIAAVLKAIEQAGPCDLLMLPELWPCGAFGFPRFKEVAEPISGPIIQALQGHARSLGCHLFGGSIIEQENGNLHNTSVLIGPSGEILSRYRKIHLFSYESAERDLLKPGCEVAVCDTAWGRFGLATCYDLRFPELFRRMVDQGAEVFLIAAGWPGVRLSAWRLFNQARAAENLAYVLACNSCGHQGDFTYAGHSLVANPKGDIVAEAGEKEEILRVKVDLSLVHQLRREFPALDHRVYR